MDTPPRTGGFGKDTGLPGGALPEGTLVVRLGEAPDGPESGLMGVLNDLVRSGLPVPEGAVLTRKAHGEFLRTSGLMGCIREASNRGRVVARRRALALLRAYGEGSLGEALDRALREGLMNMGVRSARVLWQGGARCGLRSIPEVREAVQEAWICPRGLARQSMACQRGEEVPTWPVLIQREVRPEHTGWTDAATGDRPGALHDVRPARRDAQGGRGIPELTVEAASALGKPVRLEWGLEGGQWYILAVQ